MRITTFAVIAGWVACFVVLNVLVKNLSLSIAHGSLLEQALSGLKNPTLYLAAALYVSCALLYFVVLGRLPLSTAGPMFMVIGTISTAAIGFFVFREPIGLVKAVGLCVCLLGISILFLSPDGP